MSLYVVYLGGQALAGRMGEDHEVVVVVAPDVPAARKQAKAKWMGAGAPHVDAVQEILVVDGYRVDLTPAGDQTRNATPLDTTWVP